VGERKEGKLKKKKSNLNKKKREIIEKINWKIIARVRRTWERGNNLIDYRH
jgi:hypothetical protein